MKEFGYREVADPLEIGGVIVRRCLMLAVDDGNSYTLSIATPDYIQTLRHYNDPIEEELKLDDNILLMDSVSDLKKVVANLKQMPWENVVPYLVEQDQTPH